MTIGIDASRANKKFRGGTEWYSFYLIKELAKLDSVNQYILYSDKPLEADLCNLSDNRPDQDGCQRIISPHNNFRAKILSWPFTYFWTQLRLSLEMLISPPDLLFIPAHTLPFIHPKKSVVTIHDIGFERDIELYSDDKIGPGGNWPQKFFDLAARLITGGKFRSNVLDYHRWSANFALKHASKIITVSEFTKKEMVEIYRADSRKIAVVHNGFNDQRYKKIQDQEMIWSVAGRYGIKDPYILYIGRLEKKKNTARLVQAYAAMRGKYQIKHKLVLAGNASLGFDEVKYIIEEFDLENEVIITGWIPDEDKLYLLNGASLFVLPSLYEGFGIPLLEAMSCGVPVAASDIGAIKEVAGSAALFFDPQSKNDIAEKMSEILTDQKISENLVIQGSLRVKNFSLAKCAENTLDVINSL